MSDFIERLYQIAETKAESEEVWDAVCTVMYADVLVLNKVLEGSEDAVIDGKAVSSVPAPTESSARSLVEAMREVIVKALPESLRDEVAESFGEIDFLSELETPTNTKELNNLLHKRTDGYRPHAFKEYKRSDARVHALAASKMKKAGVDEVDINAAIRESDLATFEAASAEFSLSHADWQLEGHGVRMDSAQEFIDNIDPSSDKKELREALLGQFEGVSFSGDMKWESA